MQLRRISATFVVLLYLVSILPPLNGAQASKGGANLTVEEVVKLSQSGFSEDLIVTKIKKNGKAFDLSAEELLELRKVGLSDTIVKFLLDPSQPYSAPAPPPAAPVGSEASVPTAVVPGPPPAKYPDDPLAALVPWEPSLYYFVQEAPAKIEIKMLLGANEGAGLGKILMKKGKMSAYLVGRSSKAKVIEPAPIFYLRLLEGKGIEEVVLVSFDIQGDRREMEMGPGPKQELKAEATRPFEPLLVGPRLYKITTGKLVKGEYLFFLMGSAEPPKGNQGKGYDFAVHEPPKPAKEKNKR